MIGTRYEEYGHFNDSLPFVLHTDLERTAFNCSKEKNWHEDLEIQLCTGGKGTVLLNGEKHDFSKDDVVVVNSNVVVGEILEVVSGNKTAVVDTYSADGTVTYVISIVNSGSTAITNLSVTDDLGAYSQGT